MTSPVPAPSPARHGRRRVLLRLFWLALAVILLWLTLRSVPLGEVWDRLHRLQPWQIALLVVVNAAVLATFSARWWLLLRAQGYTVPYHALVGYRLATFAISYFTPGPHFGGEPLQVYVVTARHAVPVAVSIAAVVMDKVLEMLANFTFLAFGVLVVFRQQVLPGQGQAELLAASVLLLLLPGSLLVALALGLHPVSGLLRAVDITWQRLFSPISLSTRVLTETSLYRTIRQSEEQSTALCRDHPFTLLLAALASLLSWLAIIGEFWLMTGVLGLELTLPEAILALVAARVAILLPLPAGLGALEASQALAMRVLGLPASAGVSLSVLIRGRDVLFGLLGLTIAGLVLWRRKEA